ncbi:hypothetical protein [Sphingomonas japonica]|uniref:Glycosyltransferase RgtA/B/C/D-like domain-containing protein n=1 Tax=Sphingomonas japonica TaxID=511662 RepID=A0ABX0TYD4_9SPHN|nr:hypothetical protein [Sphingomonas japonica]NIJ23330.1 hypothetical protein [Sphingomonas japonica]
MQSRRPDRLTLLLLFALVWGSIAAFGSWEWNPNNTTRLFAAISLVEDGDARIDEFAPLTIDKATFDGHSYMDKAPGTTLMALPVVAAVHGVTGERSGSLGYVFGNEALGGFLKLRLRLIVALIIAPLTALAAVLLYDLGLGLTGNRGGALFGALGFGLGSPVWGWSTTLFGHAPVTALLVVAIWAIRRATRPGARRPVPGFALAGAALGWTLVIEHPALLVGAPVGLWGLWRAARLSPAMRNPMLGAALAAGVVALLPLLGYNLAAFGTPFRLGYQGVVGFEGMQQGLFGLTYPKPEVLAAIVFGTDRGMIWVAPVMLLAPFGIARLIRNPDTRDLGWLAVGGAATAFLYNASYFYWNGGNATGPRHTLPALAYLAIGLAPYWADIGGRIGRWLASGLLALSIAVNAVIASAEVFAPDPATQPGRSILDLVWHDRFARGYLRTIASEYGGWTPWQGFEAWAIAAVFLLALLIFRTRRLT